MSERGHRQESYQGARLALSLDSRVHAGVKNFLLAAAGRRPPDEPAGEFVRRIAADHGESTRPSHDEADSERRETLSEGDQPVAEPRGDFSFPTIKLRHESNCSPLSAVWPEVVENLSLEKVLSEDDHQKLTFYLSEVSRLYESVEYHNAMHAADVTYRISTILSHAGIVGHEEALVAAVAAAAHDVKHPGRSNTFLVNSQDSSAARWGGKSVLEHESISTALSLLQLPELNFLQSYSSRQQAGFKRYFSELILATDCALHFDILDAFAARIVPKAESARHALLPEADQATSAISEQTSSELQTLRAKHAQRRALMSLSTNQKKQFIGEQQGKDSQFYAGLKSEDRLLVLQVALKIADIGHCCMPLGQHLMWLNRLETEMFVQGNEEREMGLPISPFMDPEQGGVTNPEIQAGFLIGFALPLLTRWVEAFPSSFPLLQQAESNLQYWQRANFSESLS